MNVSIEQGRKTLLKEVERGSPAPSVEGGRLPLSAIRTSPELQPRGSQGGSGDSEKHVKGLIRSIKGQPDGHLDPILVWWSGAGWYVVDGHHRLTAYRQVEKEGKAKWGPDGIPVEVLEGDYGVARPACLRGNSKAKLEMVEQDRLNAAWNLTVDGIGSQREVMASASVSEGTVKNMRRALRTLRERGVDEDEIGGLDWKKALGLLNGTVMPANRSEEWVERLAEEWKDRLRQQFKDKPISSPDIFAAALRRYSPNLAKQLVGSYEFSDLVEEEMKARLEERGLGHLLNDEEADF